MSTSISQEKSERDVVVSVRDFHKTFHVGFFRRKVEAVRGISFEVHRGETFGLLGPNGAGKTSTLKNLLRLSFPTSGELRIFGVPPSRRESMKRVGYMPENPYIYQYLSAPEFLDFCARVVGMDRATRKKRVAEMIELVGLGHAGDRPVQRFSKGMLQRAGLAQALIHDPELLVLDEPMSGLDPIGRREIREILEAERARGKTIIFTSHILSDVERLCDRVVVLKHGKVHAEGSIGEFRNETLDIHVRNPGQGTRTVVSTLDALESTLHHLKASGGEILSVIPGTESLEALFTDEPVDSTPGTATSASIEAYTESE